MAFEQNPLSQSTFGNSSGALGAAQRNRVLRNTYVLLAISMVPTVLGAWIGIKTGFSFFSGSPFIAMILFMAVAFGFFFAIDKFKNSSFGKLMQKVPGNPFQLASLGSKLQSAYSSSRFACTATHS